ncbi:SDR family NAD(P)-dependent oxidoreductase [Mucilaginibacter segetis]|uniref:SDR family NAD(P)-dependent oxidoreductase n=1 Tax=Mucilaginibacter segetis TaxID=2793071 RepID=A0A934UMJ9_9SPHI|nr:SDR family NAD(P)-dependent oxidoreductase [Mucilaginibacter segetis]MBK0378967.1 SDR family NAD(P)-dependent oxidoreductase [Mucilaginibacter segetis]
MPYITTVITGATSGIGRETALALAKKDHAVYMLVRDVKKGELLRDEITGITKNSHVYVIECDLADMQSINSAANTLKSGLMAINVLINNAGGIFAQRQESKDGVELTLAVNHLGHFLLVQNLLPLLERGQARVINISSEAHRMGKPNFRDIQSTIAYSAFKAYAMSKLFNIYFARSLAIKYGPKGISSFALHPGVVNTSFGADLKGLGKILLWFMRPFMLSAEQGAQTSVYLATAPRIDAKSGNYFKNKHVVNPANIATKEKARDKLWDISMEMVGPFLQ